MVVVLSFTGCKQPVNKMTEENPFIGSWTGTAIFLGTSAPATVVVTEAAWAISAPTESVNESYSYVRSGKNAASLKSGGVVCGSATLSGNTMTITIISGFLAGGTGTFTK